jgi:hypothetical protein
MSRQITPPTRLPGTPKTPHPSEISRDAFKTGEKINVPRRFVGHRDELPGLRAPFAVDRIRGSLPRSRLIEEDGWRQGPAATATTRQVLGVYIEQHATAAV